MVPHEALLAVGPGPWKMNVTAKIGGGSKTEEALEKGNLMWSRVSMLGLRPPCKAKIWLSTRAVRGR